ncbi:MAG TPA: ATP-binding protein, partial [Nannocystis sp.]
RSAAILDRFAGLAHAGTAPPGVADRDLLAQIPTLLAEIAAGLVDDERPAPLQAPPERVELAAIVHAHDLLHGCVLDLLEEATIVPGPGELRRLAGLLAAATGHAVRHRSDEHRDGAEDERRHLLGLFQQAPGFVCFLRGPELVFELANAAYYQLVGHRDILGKPVRAALPEVEGQGYFELLGRVLSEGEPFIGRGMRVLLQREPGAAPSEAFIDLIYQPIRDHDGRVSGILAQGHDVTEVKRQEAQRQLAEAALRDSEARYRTLFESIDDGFCLIQVIFDERGDPVDYCFIETNAAFENQTGLRDAIGKTIRELVPDLDESWFRLYGRVATTGESTRFENHAPAMGRWFEVYASRVGAPERRLVALVFKDVSERRRVEEERGRLFELESEARRKAEDASRLRDEFLTTVSHELRTPLTAILGWVQMLRAGSVPPERRERALETVERNARAQAQLIEDLLDVSSILAGKMRLEVESVEVRAVVEAALETVRPSAEAKHVHLQATLAPAAAVMADCQRMQQVVWNLLANAVKFTPAGGHVHVLVERHEVDVEITVADTGKGIPRDFQPHVFERFRQADGATTRAHGGLGLGLSIVRQLVEMHGGTVSVFSEGEGRGATFTVRLPLAAPRPRPARVAPGRDPHGPGLPAPPELAGLHVLVVEDEPDTGEMLRNLLEQCGLEVTLADSVATALDRFAERRPDLLLSDIGMPGEDGHVLIQRIRRLPAGHGGDLPAVALTAYARAEDRTRALLAGFDNHVAKPVDPGELLAVLASLATRPASRRA